MPGETDAAPSDNAAPVKEAPFWTWALFTVYCVEAGFVLAVLPWTQYWEGNSLFHRWPLLMKIGVSGAARGAVTALGVFVLWTGIESLARRIASLPRCNRGKRVFRKADE